jgi:hypothetical protein
VRYYLVIQKIGEDTPGSAQFTKRAMTRKCPLKATDAEEGRGIRVESESLQIASLLRTYMVVYIGEAPEQAPSRYYCSHMQAGLESGDEERRPEENMAQRFRSNVQRSQ